MIKKSLSVLLCIIMIFSCFSVVVPEVYAANGAKAFCAVEMSNGQMIDDVKLSINCQKPVHLINRMGGFVPSVEEIVERAKAILDGGAK